MSSMSPAGSAPRNLTDAVDDRVVSPWWPFGGSTWVFDLPTPLACPVSGSLAPCTAQLPCFRDQDPHENDRSWAGDATRFVSST